MRISDIIAYLGKDRQDAIKIGLIPMMILSLQAALDPPTPR